MAGVAVCGSRSDVAAQISATVVLEMFPAQVTVAGLAQVFAPAEHRVPYLGGTVPG